MKHLTRLILAIALPATAPAAIAASAIADSPNGISFPADYPNWSVISVSHRHDNHTMRAILGNKIAIRAARHGQTNPWPDGSIIGKVVWKETQEKNWPTAIAPDRFVHAEFMFKDAKKWAGNGTGWGWARWKGEQHKPYGKDASVGKECISCHTPVKNRDWVFTTPALFPTVFK